MLTVLVGVTPEAFENPWALIAVGTELQINQLTGRRVQSVEPEEQSTRRREMNLFEMADDFTKLVLNRPFVRTVGQAERQGRE